MGRGVEEEHFRQRQEGEQRHTGGKEGALFGKGK